MKLTWKLLASTAFVAMAASQAHSADLTPTPEPVAAAFSHWDAYVSGAAGYNWWSGESGLDQLDDWTGQIRGTVAYQFENGVGIQGDTSLTYLGLGDIEGFDVDSKSVDVTGHLFYRQKDAFLLGAIAQYGTDSYHVDFPGDPSTSVDRYYVGAEAQGYFGNFTLYGQGGYTDTEVFGADIDGYFAAAEARYFVTPDWKIQGSVGYSKISTNDFGDFGIRSWTAGAETEYRFSTMPLSAFLKYDYTSSKFEENNSIEFNTNTVLAGIKLNLGTDTLLERDRGGATLDQVKIKDNLAFFGFES